jgi:hypothetical protein
LGERLNGIQEVAGFDSTSDDCRRPFELGVFLKLSCQMFRCGDETDAFGRKLLSPLI